MPDREEEGDRARPVEQAQASARAGRDVNEDVAPRPEHDGRHHHQHAGDPERDADAQHLPCPRDQQVGEEAAEVDDEVERLEDGAQSEPVALPELIADVGGDARLDPARADRDQRRAPPDAPDRVRAQREQEAAAGVDDRQPQDRAVLAQQAIRDDRADHRQRVDRGEEQVEMLLRGGLGSASKQPVLGVQHGQVRRQERTDPVKRETLGALVADDVRDAGRPAGALLIGGAARRHPRLLARLATRGDDGGRTPATKTSWATSSRDGRSTPRSVSGRRAITGGTATSCGSWRSAGSWTPSATCSTWAAASGTGACCSRRSCPATCVSRASIASRAGSSRRAPARPPSGSTGASRTSRARRSASPSPTTRSI